jgi:hypothetical protein
MRCVVMVLQLTLHLFIQQWNSESAHHSHVSMVERALTCLMAPSPASVSLIGQDLIVRIQLYGEVITCLYSFISL